MKIKLLKALPWAEIGEVIETNDEDTIIVFDGATLIASRLIEKWWAEELVDEKQFWIPKNYEKFFRLSEFDWVVEEKRFSESENLLSFLSKIWLIFKTEEQAKKRLLFLELSNSNGGWVPNKWEDYWTVYPPSGVVWCYENRDSTYWFDISYVMVWNCYKTREQAEKYSTKWKEYFDLIK